MILPHASVSFIVHSKIKTYAGKRGKANWNTLATNKFQFILTQIEIDIKANIHAFDTVRTRLPSTTLPLHWSCCMSTFYFFSWVAPLHYVGNLGIECTTIEHQNSVLVAQWSHAAGQRPLLISKIGAKITTIFTQQPLKTLELSQLPLCLFKRILMCVEWSYWINKNSKSSWREKDAQPMLP